MAGVCKARSPFQQFLAGGAAKLDPALFSQEYKDSLVLVFGNQAGDVDSIVSSLALAFAWLHLSPHSRLQSSSAGEPTLAVPVGPFAHNEFRLRGDAVALFKYAGISMEENSGAPAGMAFIDQVPPGLCGVALALTDHNEPAEPFQATFGENVIGILDHHQDSGKYEKANPRIVDTTCGSACSLVTNLICDRCPSLFSDDLATLLAGAILLDTRNFSTSAKRFSGVDLEAMSKLNEFLPKKERSESAKAALYQQLMDARLDVGHLASGDLLRIDFKSATVGGSGALAGRQVGFCSIPGTLSYLISKAGDERALAKELHEFREERGLSAVMCLCAKEDSGPKVRTRGKGLMMATESSQGDMREALLKVLHESEHLLTSELRENELLHAQGIVAEGFSPLPLPDLPHLDSEGVYFFSLRSKVTRKTLMPTHTGVLATL